jgi:hypothetical protein
LPGIARSSVARAATGAELTLDMQVQGDFMNGKVLPDHRYYTGGPQNSPNAIVAVSLTTAIMLSETEVRIDSPLTTVINKR